jgi:hypothetical protein
MQCPPLIITDSIIWFPYNNSLDSQGNSLPQRSNFIAIQFNRRLTANPAPVPFSWEITGDACVAGPPPGRYNPGATLAPPLGQTINKMGQRIYFNPLAGPATYGWFPFELSINMPNPFINGLLSTRISPSVVYLMDDLEYIPPAGPPAILQASGQWLVFVVGHGPNNNPVNGPLVQYETILASGSSTDLGGIENNPNAELQVKVNYIPNAPGLTPGSVPTAGAMFPAAGPLLFSDDCNGFSAPVSGFSSNFLTFERKDP